MLKVLLKKRNSQSREAIVAAIAPAQNIHLVEEIFSDEDMASFQEMGDVYLSLHRAEGYGLNIHEMLERGKPVIATGWSGNMDYMPAYSNAVAIPYRLVPYADSTHHYEDLGQTWAEPDVDAATEALQRIYAAWCARRHKSTPTCVRPMA